MLEEPSAMFRLTGLAALEHRAGNQPAAERAFAQLVSEVGDAAMYQQAEVMAQWGRTDEALRGCSGRGRSAIPGLSMVATDPLLDPIAKDPDYQVGQRSGLRLSRPIAMSAIRDTLVPIPKECRR